MRQSEFSTNDRPLFHMPQLDGLRAVAVLMVGYHHWMPWGYQFSLPLGAWGVDLFFVLSGFLITGILLKCREEYIEEGGQAVTVTAIRFYARRFLRIFPLYYGALLLYALISRTPFNELTPWLWTYTLNIYRVIVDDHWESPISHFWSLSVEEQFYFVWPLVILLVPRRFILHVIVSAIIIGPVTQLMMAVSGWSVRSIRYFTLSCLDTLAFGAVLAYFVRRKSLSAVKNSLMMKWLFWISFPMLILDLFFEVSGNVPLVPALLLQVFRPLFFGWVVVMAANGFKGGLGRFLSSGPVMYIGQISYALYLLHKPVPLLLQKLGFPAGALPPLFLFLIYAGVTVMIASISWYYFEAPINALKRYFPYQARNPLPVLSHEAR